MKYPFKRKIIIALQLISTLHLPNNSNGFQNAPFNSSLEQFEPAAF